MLRKKNTGKQHRVRQEKYRTTKEQKEYKEKGK